MVLLWQPEPTILQTNRVYEAGIVLGGMSDYDKNNRGFFGDNADRFIQIANLYHQGIIKLIIVSGGTGSLDQDNLPEAPFLRTQLIANGIPDSAIIIESKSKNTYENAVFSKKLIDSLEIKSTIILITSALHMKRSRNVFNKAGFNYISFPCDYKVVPTKFGFDDLIVPDISLLKEWGFFLKEIIGLYAYKLTGKA